MEPDILAFVMQRRVLIFLTIFIYFTLTSWVVIFKSVTRCFLNIVDYVFLFSLLAISCFVALNFLWCSVETIQKRVLPFLTTVFGIQSLVTVFVFFFYTIRNTWQPHSVANSTKDGTDNGLNQNGTYTIRDELPPCFWSDLICCISFFCLYMYAFAFFAHLSSNDRLLRFTQIQQRPPVYADCVARPAETE